MVDKEVIIPGRRIIKFGDELTSEDTEAILLNVELVELERMLLLNHKTKLNGGEIERLCKK